MRLASGSCSCLVMLAMATAVSSTAFGITDNSGAMLAPPDAISREKVLAVIADTANSSTKLDTALMALLDQVLTENSRNEDDLETDEFGVCCTSPDDGVTPVTCVPGPSCKVVNGFPKGQCDTLHGIPAISHKFLWCDDLTRSPSPAPTFLIPTPMPTFPDPYPRGMCPDGYYQATLIAVEGCDPVVGEINVELTKSSRTASALTILKLPMNIVNVTVNLTSVHDYDLFLLEAVDSFNNDCIVGFECQYKYACDHLDGFHPCWPSEDPVFFYSGDLEGHLATEVIRINKVTWDGYFFGVVPVQTGPATIRYSWNGIIPCGDYDYDQAVTDNCLVKPTVAPTRSPTPSPTDESQPAQSSVTPDDPTPDNPPVTPVTPDEPGGYGDPHLTNIRGEHFDLNSPGEHLLVQIPRGSGSYFQLHATVAQFNAEGRRKACKFFFTNFSMSGAWLGLDINDKIEVWAGKGGSLDDFGLMHRPQRSLTEFKNLTDFRNLVRTRGAAMLGGTAVQACSDTVDSESHALCQGLAHKFRRKPKKVLLTLPCPMPVHLVVSRYESANPAFLDISIDGIGAHPAEDVAGLMGDDDHSEVSSWPANCPPKRRRN